MVQSSGLRSREEKCRSFGFSLFDSSSTVSNPDTLLRNSAISGFCSGFSVASTMGKKILLSISWKLRTDPVATHVLYSRGIWIIHMLFGELRLLFTTHFERFSHSSRLRPYMLSLHSVCWYFDSSRSVISSRVISAKYLPPISLSDLRKIVRSTGSSRGLYFRLKRSKRWKTVWSATTLSLSRDRSRHPNPSFSNTSVSVSSFPPRVETTSSPCVFSFFLMKRSRCFAFMDAEWCTCVSTFRTL
mmetsp:Transcript_58030/g.149370  ORF Transcript_58030/g.149370 Transcript_58030/m.149370 type:complete len:244 (-) Transcript_58030:414-1145(-)